MAKCPNCGRETLRTQDWACQWCGYPLLTGNYKSIAKTFKQIQEEKQAAESQQSVEYAEEPVIPPEPKPEPPPSRMPPRTKPPIIAGRPRDEGETEGPSEPSRVPPRARPAFNFGPGQARETQGENVPEPPPPSRVPPRTKPAFNFGPVPEKPQAGPAGQETKPELPTMESTGVGKAPAEAKMEAAAELQRERPGLMAEAGPVPEVKTGAKESPRIASPEPVPFTAPPPQVNIEKVLNRTSLTADEIDQVYRSAADQADQKYAGKLLTVSGVVERVFINDGLGVYYVILTGSRPDIAWNTRCTFSTEQLSDVRKLTSGQALTIQGKYGGHGKNIILRECALVR